MLLLSFSVVGSGGTRIAVVTKDNERHGASWDEYVPTGRGGQKGGAGRGLPSPMFHRLQ